MYPDGVCRVTDNYYTKTVQFQDINYQLNQNEDKTAIFDGWCDFLNYFDSSIRFQLSFINLSATRDTYARRIAIPLQGDCFDKLRTEYTGMLQSQLARGNNGLIKTKYLTFGVEADSLKAAKPRLERIETDILNNFRRLGVQAEALNGMERLRLLHGMLHMDEPQPFRFSWDWLAPSGLSVKDFIAPSAFEFKTGSSFGVGSKTGCVSFLQILAPELNDRMLADFLDMESSLIVSMHVQSVDQVKAIKTIKRKITDLQKMTMLILVAFLGLMFFGMIAPIKGVWDICVDENDVTVIKAFFYKRHWKISDISYCKRKRGGMNVYVNGRKKKAFFVDGMTDHFDNFIKRMEKEGKEIILPETKEKR